jgi:hypothetical protein
MRDTLDLVRRNLGAGSVMEFAGNADEIWCRKCRGADRSQNTGVRLSAK